MEISYPPLPLITQLTGSFRFFPIYPVAPYLCSYACGADALTWIRPLVPQLSVHKNLCEFGLFGRLIDVGWWLVLIVQSTVGWLLAGSKY